MFVVYRDTQPTFEDSDSDSDSLDESGSSSTDSVEDNPNMATNKEDVHESFQPHTAQEVDIAPDVSPDNLPIAYELRAVEDDQCYLTASESIKENRSGISRQSAHLSSSAISQRLRARSFGIQCSIPFERSQQARIHHLWPCRFAHCSVVALQPRQDEHLLSHDARAQDADCRCCRRVSRYSSCDLSRSVLLKRGSHERGCRLAAPRM